LGTFFHLDGDSEAIWGQFWAIVGRFWGFSGNILRRFCGWDFGSIFEWIFGTVFPFAIN
jgi:hypothetical protein